MCLRDQCLLPAGRLPVQSHLCTAARAGERCSSSAPWAWLYWLRREQQQPFLRLQCLLRATRVYVRFYSDKGGSCFAGVFWATHYLWGERNLKNSLIYHVKKRWHIYCYINVIYIVFSVTLTEIFLNFLLLVGKVYQQYLEIWHRVQICNKPTMETGEQDEKQFISDN